MSMWAFLGSGEFDPWHDEVDRRLLAGRAGPVLVAPAASAHEGEATFDGWAGRGVAHYERLGVEVLVLPLRTRDDAADPAVAAALDDAAMVFFSGGNPWRLAEMLRDTLLWDRLNARVADGLAFAGCSAGVAFMNRRTFDSDADDMDRIFQPGLARFGGALFAPHWDMVDTWVPGASAFIAASMGSGETLVGLDERTAMVGDGARWDVSGAGGVHILRDGGWEHHAAGSSFTLALEPG
jgi:cyanophycinase